MILYDGIIRGACYRVLCELGFTDVYACYSQIELKCAEVLASLSHPIDFVACELIRRWK